MDHGRRTFCKVCIGGLSAVSAASVAYPIVSFLGRPTSLEAGKPVEVPLDRVAAGQAMYVDVHGQQVIILGTSDPNQPEVFSASCPLLGCNVAWLAADSIFKCPCHGATFNAEGNVISGPVSASLRKIKAPIKDGKVILS